MSYRRKRPQHHPAPVRLEQQEQISLQTGIGEATYNNPGVDKVIHSARLPLHGSCNQLLWAKQMVSQTQNLHWRVLPRAGLRVPQTRH